MKKNIILFLWALIVGIPATMFAQTFENQAVNAVFPLSGAALPTKATVDVDGAFKTTIFTMGNQIEVSAYEKAVGSYFTGTVFQEPNATALTMDGKLAGYELDLVLTPSKGLTFVPTGISFEAAKSGTGDDIKISLFDAFGTDEESEIVSGLATLRNNVADGDFSITSAITREASSESYKIKVYIHGKGFRSGKGLIVGDITVTGTVNGTIIPLPKYQLGATVSPEGAGTITSVPSGTEFDEGDVIALTATKNFGYKFKEWVDASSNVLGTAATLDVTLNNDSNVIAVFETVETYELVVNLNLSDYVISYSPEYTLVDGKKMYEVGTEVTLSARSNVLIPFDCWQDGSTGDLSITMNSNQEVTANYDFVDFIAGWDFYYAGNTNLPPTFANEKNVSSAVFSIRNAEGTVATWLDKSEENGASYEGKFGAVNWKPLADKYYYQTCIDATGHGDVVVSAKMLYNYNAYQGQILQYSFDDVNYISVDTLIMGERKVWYTLEGVIPTGGASTVYIRWIPDYTSTVDGTESTNDGTAITDVFVYPYKPEKPVCTTDFSFKTGSSIATLTAGEGCSIYYSLGLPVTAENYAECYKYEAPFDYGGLVTFSAIAVDANGVCSEVVYGMDDAVEIDSKKPVVAYVYESGYNSYNYEEDPIYIELAKKNNVIPVALTKGEVADTADLVFADVVVLTEAMSGNQASSNTLVDLVGKVPVVHLKAFNYTSGRWSWGTPANATKTVTTANLTKSNLAIFSNVTVTGGTVSLFDATSANFDSNVNHIQTLSALTVEGADTIAMTDGNVAIHTLGQNYLFVGLSSDNCKALSTDAVSIVKNAVKLLAHPDEFPEGLNTTLGETYYELVTSNNELVDGGKYLIVAKNGDSYFAVSSQSSNNRAAVEVTVVNNEIRTEIAASADETTLPYLFKLKACDDGEVTGWAWVDLVADTTVMVPKSQANRWLRLYSDVADTMRCTIDVDATGIATVKYTNAAYDRNWLRYNSSSKLFACYASGQMDVSLYKTVSSMLDLDEVEAPTVTPGSCSFYGSEEISISTEEEGKIYYSLDGTELTESNYLTSGILYESGITITDTTTLNAIVVRDSDGKLSKQVSNSYIKGLSLDNLAAFKALTTGTTAGVNLENAVVLGQNGGNLYIKDATGAMLVYGFTAPTYAAGTILNGTLVGKASPYNQLFEIASPDFSKVTATEGTAPEPVEVKIADLISNYDTYESDYVTVKNVKFLSSTLASRAVTFTDGVDTFTVYDTHKVLVDVTFPVGYTVNITGFVLRYKTTLQICVLSADDVALKGTFVSLPIEATEETGLPGTSIGSQYSWTSPTYILDMPIDTLRLTVYTTNTGDAGGGKPCFALSEFYLYDGAGNPIALNADNIWTNAQEPSEGPLANLYDGNTSNYFHTAWHAGVTDDYHYLEIALPEPMYELSFGFVSRNLRCVPTLISVADPNYVNEYQVEMLRDKTQAFVTTTLDMVSVYRKLGIDAETFNTEYAAGNITVAQVNADGTFADYATFNGWFDAAGNAAIEASAAICCKPYGFYAETPEVIAVCQSPSDSCVSGNTYDCNMAIVYGEKSYTYKVSYRVISAELPLTLTVGDGLPGVADGSTYTWQSRTYNFEEAVTSLRLTVKATNVADTDGAGYPCFALGEFFVVDAEGNNVTLTADNFVTNAQETSEGPIANICDGDASTYFHSIWGGSASDYHYIQVTLPEPMYNLSFGFVSRNLRCVPTEIYLSDPYLLTTGDSLPGTSDGARYNWTSGEYRFNAPVDKLRLTVKETNTGDTDYSDVYKCFALGEFYLYDLEGNAVTLAAENFSTNAQETSEGPIANICDGDVSSYFHTIWGASATDYHYVEVALPEPMYGLSFGFASRNLRCVPTKVNVSVSEYVAPPFVPEYELSAYANSSYAMATGHINLDDLYSAFDLTAETLTEAIASFSYYQVSVDTLGVETLIPAATNDGWFNAAGNPQGWGNDARICVKPFNFNTEDPSEINVCQMPGTCVAGDIFSGKLAIVYGEKTFSYIVKLNVLAEPVFEPVTFETLRVSVLADAVYTNYEGQALDLTEELAALGITDLSATKLYGIVDSTLTTAYTGTNGFWMNADGAICSWGADGCTFCFDAYSAGTMTFCQFPGATALGDFYKTIAAIGYENGDADVLVFLEMIYMVGYPAGEGTCYAKDVNAWLNHGTVDESIDSTLIAGTWSYQTSADGIEFNVTIDVPATSENWGSTGFYLDPDAIEAVFGIAPAATNIETFYPLDAAGNNLEGWSSYLPGQWYTATGDAAAWDTGAAYWYYQIYPNTYYDFSDADGYMMGYMLFGKNPDNITLDTPFTQKSILNGKQWNVTITLVDNLNPTGIKNINSVNGEVKSESYYNVSGAAIEAPAKGINIRRTVYTDGTVKVEKVFIK